MELGFSSGWGQWFFSSPQCPGRICSPPSLQTPLPSGTEVKNAWFCYFAAWCLLPLMYNFVTSRSRMPSLQYSFLFYYVVQFIISWVIFFCSLLIYFPTFFPFACFSHCLFFVCLDLFFLYSFFVYLFSFPVLHFIICVFLFFSFQSASFFFFYPLCRLFISVPSLSLRFCFISCLHLCVALLCFL